MALGGGVTETFELSVQVLCVPVIIIALASNVCINCAVSFVFEMLHNQL